MRSTLQAALSCMVALGLCAHIEAIDWGTAKIESPRVSVLGMEADTLVAGAAAGSNRKVSWAKVPDQFTKNGAVVYAPPDGKVNPVADITVTLDGYLFLACDYDYEGNKDGDWKKEAWDEAKFKAKGWHVMSKADMGGDLVTGDNRKLIVYMKQVRKGDTLRLRCNKYRPPFVIVLGNK